MHLSAFSTRMELHENVHIVYSHALFVHFLLVCEHISWIPAFSPSLDTATMTATVAAAAANRNENQPCFLNSIH